MTNDQAETFAEAVSETLMAEFSYQLSRYFTAEAALQAATLRVRDLVERVLDREGMNMLAEVYAAKAEERPYDLFRAVNGYSKE